MPEGRPAGGFDGVWIVFGPAGENDDVGDLEPIWLSAGARARIKESHALTSVRGLFGDRLDVFDAALLAWQSDEPVECADVPGVETVFETFGGERVIFVRDDTRLLCRVESRQEPPPSVVQDSANDGAPGDGPLGLVDLVSEGVVVLDPVFVGDELIDLTYRSVSAPAARMRGVVNTQALRGVSVSSQGVPADLVWSAGHVWESFICQTIHADAMKALGWADCHGCLYRVQDNLVLVIRDVRSHNETVEKLQGRVEFFERLERVSSEMIALYRPVFDRFGRVEDLTLMYGSPVLRDATPGGPVEVGDSMLERYGPGLPLLDMAEESRTAGCAVQRDLAWVDDDLSEMYRLRVDWEDSLVVAAYAQVSDYHKLRQRAAERDQFLYTMAEKLPLPVSRYEIEFDSDGEVVDLVCDYVSEGARRGTPACPELIPLPKPGVRVSQQFVDPEKAVRAARQLVHVGEADTYEVELTTVIGPRTFEVHSLLMGSRLFQFVFDVTESRTRQDDLMVVLDHLDVAAHLHTPVFVDGQLVDTVVLYANKVASLVHPIPEDGTISATELFPIAPPEIFDAYQSAWFNPGVSAAAAGSCFDVHGTEWWFDVSVVRIGSLLLSVGYDVTEENLIRRGLAESETRYLQTMDMFPFPVIVAEPVFVDDVITDGRVVYANPAERSRRPQSVSGSLASECFEAAAEVGASMLAEAWSSPDRVITRALVSTADGVESTLIVTARRAGDRLVAYSTDMSDIDRARAQARRSEKTLRTVLAALPIPVAEWHKDECGYKRVGFYNAAASGFSPELAWRHIEPWFEPAMNDGRQVYEVVVDDKVWEVHLAAVEDRVLSWAIDMTETTRHVNDLERQVLADPLTGLGNLENLKRTVDDRLASGDGASFALVVVELVNFDEIRRSVGLTISVDFVRIAARALRRALTAEAGLNVVSISRTVGGSFAVVLDEVGDPGPFVDRIERVCQTLSNQVHTVNEMHVRMRFHAGVAFSPLHADSQELLSRAANDAAWAAQDSNRVVSVWSPSVAGRHLEHLGDLSRLESAIADGDLFLEFHPRLDLASGELIGLEAQTRWATSGSVAPPQHFAELLLSSVFSPVYTEWLFDALCAEAAVLFPSLGVPVSADVPVGSVHAGSVELLTAALVKHGLAAGSVGLELPSHDPAIRDSAARSTVHDLRQIGVHLILDRFGAEGGTPGGLRRLPVNEVKLDRLFARRLDTDRFNQEIVRSLVNVAAATDIECSLEGIERVVDAEQAMSLGCRTGQGFAFFRPMSTRAVLRTFKKQS